MQIVNTLIHCIWKSRRLHIVQMANPKTVTMQYMDLFSHLTAQLPVWEMKLYLRRHGNSFATINPMRKKTGKNVLNITVCWIVPKARVCCLQPGSVLLHDYTVNCRKRTSPNKLLCTCFDTGLQAVDVWIFIAVRSEHIPIYLKGFPSLLSCPRHSSSTLLVHWFTLVCW